MGKGEKHWIWTDNMRPCKRRGGGGGGRRRKRWRRGGGEQAEEEAGFLWSLSILGSVPPLNNFKKSIYSLTTRKNWTPGEISTLRLTKGWSAPI